MRSFSENEFIILYDVRVYSKVVDLFSWDDLNAIEVSPKSVLHITRHLSALDEDARKKLIGLPINDRGVSSVVDSNFLDLQLQTVGSKFNSKCRDPFQLIEFAKTILMDALEEKIPIFWFASENESLWAIYQTDISSQKKSKMGLNFEEFLGTQSVVKILPEDRLKMVRMPRGQGEEADRQEVNFIQGQAPPFTDTLVIILSKNASNVVHIQTAYSGIFTPNFPSLELKEEERLYCQEWWDNHAFIQ